MQINVHKWLIKWFYKVTSFKTSIIQNAFVGCHGHQGEKKVELTKCVMMQEAGIQMMSDSTITVPTMLSFISSTELPRHKHG
jgi:hypothetical protein